MSKKIRYGKTKPTELSRGRAAKTCKRCGQWFSAPKSEIARQAYCSDDCTTAKTDGKALDTRIAARERQDEAFAAAMGVPLTYREMRA